MCEGYVLVKRVYIQKKWYFSTLFIEKHDKVLQNGWKTFCNMDGKNVIFVLKGKKWKVSEGYLLEKERYFDPTIYVTGEETLDQDH